LGINVASSDVPSGEPDSQSETQCSLCNRR
jgi:hypothetical protein